MWLRLTAMVWGINFVGDIRLQLSMSALYLYVLELLLTTQKIPEFHTDHGEGKFERIL